MSKDTVFNDLKEIHDKLNKLEVSPSLIWLWSYDVLGSILDDYQFIESYNDYVIAEGTTFRDIFDKFYDDVESLELHIGIGKEILEEVLFDWMIDKGFLVSLDDDGWLE